MKIVHVIDFFQPQAGYQETYLAIEQAKLGHDVSVVTSDLNKNILYSKSAEKVLLRNINDVCDLYLENGIKVYRLKTRCMILNRPWIIGLEDVIRSVSPDVVHMHIMFNLSSVRIAVLKLRLRNFRLIYDEHTTFSYINFLTRL